MTRIVALDHIVLITRAHVQLCGDVEDLLAEHQLLAVPQRDAAAVAVSHTIVHATVRGRQAALLVRLGGPVLNPAYETSDVRLEDLVLGYLSAAAPGYAGLAAAGGTR